MTLPSLAEFIRLMPAGAASASPSRWLEDCLQSGVDYLILLDDQGVPYRGMALNQILTLVNPAAISLPDSRHPAATETSPSVSQAILDQVGTPLTLVDLATPIKTVAQAIADAPEQCWVVVNAQQHYQGLLDKPKLLAAVWQTTILEQAAPARPAENQTSRSNTALLTYLGHELKTPLTSLLGLSSLLKIGGDNLTPRQSRYTSLIQQHCRRLAAWINTLIDLGRIESGALRLVPQLVDLPPLWAEAYAQAALRAGLERETPPLQTPPRLQEPGQPLKLVADPTRLQQMLSCLMQTALAHHDKAQSMPSIPLNIALWQHWVGFVVAGIDDAHALEHLSQAVFLLPFSETPLPATPIAAEMGHWLEWLLVRKLAQLHQGDLVMTVQESAVICPTLLLPLSPVPAATRTSRFLLVVAPLDLDSLETLWQQANQLNYQLLITPHIKDALEIVEHLPIAAVLVLLQPHQLREDLQGLKVALENTGSLAIALVPPNLSAYLGELPVDRELLWPTERLGSVLLQPPPLMPAPSRLTILYLRSNEQIASPDQRFPHIFHDFGCRVLEVDDLEQARLLRRVWKPDVAVLDPAIAAPQTYLKTLSQMAELTSLPLITLTLTATQAAHASPNLAVYPCLVEEASWNTPESVERMSAWLVQVLQVAATGSRL